MRLATALLIALVSTACFAQTTQLIIQFEVKSQPLGDALRSLVAQVNGNIIYDPSLVRGHEVQGFVMRATMDEALTRLLKGSGLRHQYVNEKTVTLVRVEPQLKTASSDSEEALPQSAASIKPAARK